MNYREATLRNVVLMMRALDLEEFYLSETRGSTLDPSVIGAKMTPFSTETRVFRLEDRKVLSEYPHWEDLNDSVDEDELSEFIDELDTTLDDLRDGFNEARRSLRDPRESEIRLMYHTLRERMRTEVVENFVDDLMASVDNDTKGK